MFDSSFKQIEQLLYTAPTETCCPVLPLAYGCLILSCKCLFVNAEYHFIPAISVFIRCVKKKHFNS